MFIDANKESFLIPFSEKEDQEMDCDFSVSGKSLESSRNSLSGCKSTGSSDDGFAVVASTGSLGWISRGESELIKIEAVFCQFISDSQAVTFADFITYLKISNTPTFIDGGFI